MVLNMPPDTGIRRNKARRHVSKYAEVQDDPPAVLCGQRLDRCRRLPQLRRRIGQRTLILFEILRAAATLC